MVKKWLSVEQLKRFVVEDFQTWRNISGHPLLNS